MNTSYDVALSKIKHFTLHPELLPYVGDQYDKFKIVIVGESHYLPDGYENAAGYFMDWYDQPTPYDIPVPNDMTSWGEDKISSFTTRNALGFLGYVYNYFEEVVHQNNLNISENIYDCVAFFNFYQRPTLKPASGFYTIFNDNREDVIACSVAKQIFDILKPNLILVLSKKVSGIIQKGIGHLPQGIFFLGHPSHGWLDKNEFKRIIGMYLMKLFAPSNSIPNITLATTTMQPMSFQYRLDNSRRNCDVFLQSIAQKYRSVYDLEKQWLYESSIKDLNLTLYDGVEDFTLSIATEIGVKHYGFNEKIFPMLKNNTKMMRHIDCHYINCRFVRYVRLNFGHAKLYFAVASYDTIEDYLKDIKTISRANVLKNDCINELRSLIKLNVPGNAISMEKLKRYNFQDYFWLEYLRVMDQPFDLIPLYDKRNIVAFDELEAVIAKHVAGMRMIDSLA